MQLAGGALFCIHYILLGVLVGGLLNGLAVVRAIVYSSRERFRGDSKLWLIAFIGASVSIYVLNFTLLGREISPPSLLLELLPVIGVVSTSIGMSMDSARATRRSSFVNSPCWLIYNLINFSIGGIAGEIICLISITVGTLRFDLKSKRAPVTLGEGDAQDAQSQITT